MKKFAVALLFCGVSAFATNVSYYTTGAFTGVDLSGSNLVNGGAGISYQAAGSSVSPISVTANPITGINLGQITVADPTDVVGNFGGNDTFTLTIWQTAPAGGSGMSSSSITGSVTGTSNNITVTVLANHARHWWRCLHRSEFGTPDRSEFQHQRSRRDHPSGYSYDSGAGFARYVGCVAHRSRNRLPSPSCSVVSFLFRSFKAPRWLSASGEFCF